MCAQRLAYPHRPVITTSVAVTVAVSDLPPVALHRGTVAAADACLDSAALIAAHLSSVDRPHA